MIHDSEIEALAAGMAPFVRDCIAEATAPLIARIAELEARPAMKYEGVWDERKVYRVGDFVTKGGSMWHCFDTNTGVLPGSNSDVWKLAVRAGKDGKDARNGR
jgi:hypothetical protein